MYMYIHQVPIKRQINLPIIISQYNNYFFGEKLPINLHSK